MSFVRSGPHIDRVLVVVAVVLQGGRLRYPTVFAVRCLVVFPATLEATAFLLPPIYLILRYKVSFGTTGFLLLL